jgi:hypothetical protein
MPTKLKNVIDFEEKSTSKSFTRIKKPPRQASASRKGGGGGQNKKKKDEDFFLEY